MSGQPTKLFSIIVGALLLGAAFLISPGRSVPRQTALVSDGVQSIAATVSDVALGGGTPPADISRFLPELHGVAGDRQIEAAIFHKVGDEAPPLITARAYLIADVQAGTIYAGNNEGIRWPLASLTKLMTGALALEVENLTAEIPYKATGQLGGDVSISTESSATLRYIGRDLLRMMLVPSDNDAAEALAQFYGRDQFLVAMNNRARELGMNQTHFEDPSGLSAANQSTAEEFRIFVQRLYRDHRELFRETMNQKINVTERNHLNTQTFISTNLFAGKSDFLGGKTGYTPEAGGNLVSLFAYRNEPVMIIVFGSDDRFHDTEQLFAWFKKNYR